MLTSALQSERHFHLAVIEGAKNRFCFASDFQFWMNSYLVYAGFRIENDCDTRAAVGFDKATKTGEAHHIHSLETASSVTPTDQFHVLQAS